MNFNCPYCKKELNFMEIIMDKDLSFIFQALPSFGTRYSHLVMGYCQLFGVTPFKLKTKKLRILLDEMKRLFDAQAFSYQKKTYPISHAGIGEALDVVIKKDFGQPLENHNYLKRVMMTIAEREGKNQSRATDAAIRDQEQKQLAGYGRPEKVSPVPGSPDDDGAPPHLSEEQIKHNLTRVRDIIKSIGG